MNIIYYLASKYLKFKAGDRGISAIAVIAFFTIVLSTAAGIVILSTVNGMHEDLYQRIMAKDAHILLLGPGEGIADYDTVISNLMTVPGVTSVVPFSDGQVLLKGASQVRGAALKAYPASFYTNDAQFASEIPVTSGTLDFSKRHSIVIGSVLATNLQAGIGTILWMIINNGAGGMGEQFPFRVTGIFQSGYEEYDENLVFISFRDSQEIYHSGGYAYGLAMKVADPDNVDAYLPVLAQKTSYYPWTWKRLNRNKLYSLENEKMLMMIILFVFFAVVFFNILSTMIAMVLDKREEVGILKAMGLRPREGLNVFLFDGFIMGAVGSLAGTVLGLFVCISMNPLLRIIEKSVNLVNWAAYYLAGWMVKSPKPAPYLMFGGEMQKFPMLVQFGDILFVSALAVAVSVLAVVAPAWKAAKMRPVEALRHD